MRFVNSVFLGISVSFSGCKTKEDEKNGTTQVGGVVKNQNPHRSTGAGGGELRNLGLGHFDSSKFTHVAVIPDVHGDAEYFMQSLWIAFQKVEPTNHGVTEQQFLNQLQAVAKTIQFPSGKPAMRNLPAPLSRIGKSVALVQLGDIMDRGPQSLFSYKILASIEHAIGWKLIQLAGNHDLMIYNPGAPGGFDLRYNLEPTDIPDPLAMTLFGPGGALSEYLSKNDLILARIGTPRTDGKEYVIDPRSPDTLFVHAGLDIYWAKDYLAESNKRGAWGELIALLNENKRSDFARNLMTASALANDVTGPLFVRNIPNAVASKIEGECVRLDQLMRSLHVSRVIVGHTPDATHRTRQYCDSRFIITDVAMSRGMTRDGQPYALVMKLDEGGKRIGSMVAHYDHPEPTGIRRDDKLLP